MKEKNVKYIGIPNVLLLDTTLNPKDKFLYVVLKTFCFDNTETTNVKKKTLMDKLNWKDNRTLLKHLNKLKYSNYIAFDFDSLPRKDYLKIKLSFVEPYTLIDNEIFDKMYSYKKKEHCLIYMFLMEMYYNNKLGFAFPSIATIQSVLKLSNSALHEISSQLHNDRWCEYNKGIYVQNDDGVWKQCNNKYLPNIMVFDSESNKYKRRYKFHKKESYFNLVYEEENYL